MSKTTTTTLLRSRKATTNDPGFGSSNGNSHAASSVLPLHNSKSSTPGTIPVVASSSSSSRRLRSRRKKRVDRSWIVPATFISLFLVAVVAGSFRFLSGFKTNADRSTSGLDSARSLQGITTFSENVKGTIHDIAIVGAGPGGLTAAMFGARAGLDVVVLGSETGLLSETQQLDNFPSFTGKNGGKYASSGPAWLSTTKEQAIGFGAKFATPGVLAKELALTRDESQQREHDDSTSTAVFTLTTNAELDEEKAIHAWSVIVATGATPRRLGLANENLLWGKSLHSCAICDGHLYSDKTVLVVGGGDSAFDAANLLARYAKKVFMVHRRLEFSGNNEVAVQVAQSTSNIEILKPYTVVEWEIDFSNGQMTGAILESVGEVPEKKILSIDGAFMMIGATPNTEWLHGAVDVDEEGLIRLDSATQSSLPGIFAVGEVSDNRYKQAITASSEGAQAAIDAERWLRETRGIHRHIDISKASSTFIQEESTQEKHSKSKELSPVDIDQTSCDLTREDCVKSTVHQFPVVVFSSSWCPYCRKALEALALAGVPDPHIIDLTTHEKSQQIKQTLGRMTGRRTVPNVFVGGKSIGGGDETAALQSQNKLVPLLVESGAIENPNVKAELEEEDGESCDLLQQSCIEEIIQKYPVVMFSLEWCPECKRVFELLSSIGASRPHVIDLDDYKEISQDIRYHMLTLSGQTGVPNLFIGGEHFGGYRKISKLHEQGKLVSKLHEVQWPMKSL